MKLPADHYVVPGEDFRELQLCAQAPASTGERVASTVQATLIFGGMSAAFIGACVGYAKATDWLEERRLRRKMNIPRDKPKTTQV